MLSRYELLPHSSISFPLVVRYESITWLYSVSLVSSPVDSPLGCSRFGAIVGSANLSIRVQVLYENVSSLLSRYLSHMVTPHFTFEELRQVFHSLRAPLHSSSSVGDSDFSVFV